MRIKEQLFGNVLQVSNFITNILRTPSICQGNKLLTFQSGQESFFHDLYVHEEVRLFLWLNIIALLHLI